MTARLRTAVVLLTLALLPVGCNTDKSAPKPPARTLLYPADAAGVPESLRPAVKKLLDPDQPTVKPEGVQAEGVFLRVTARRFVLDGGRLKDGGWLGSRPFVFLTVPETIYGRSLLEVFSGIGYGADEVLAREVGDEKVAVVFRYEKAVRLEAGGTYTTPVAPRVHVFVARGALLRSSLAEPLHEGDAFLFTDEPVFPLTAGVETDLLVWTFAAEAATPHARTDSAPGSTSTTAG